MNKNDLIAAVAEETDISKAKAAEVVDAVFGAIEKSLKQKLEVRLVGFGTFATPSVKLPRAATRVPALKSTSPLPPRSVLRLEKP